MHALVAEVLAAWRRAERLINELQPGTPEHRAAEDACARLKALYADLTNAGIVRDPAAIESIRRAIEQASEPA